MARPKRIEYQGAFHHVMSRGVDGMNIFRDDLDRKLFVELLEKTVVRHGWLLHDWVLMSNHYHLAIETPECTLSKGMQWLLGRYAQRFNRRHGRRGPLYQDRFKSVLIDREEYLLTVARYIALNPVKAGIVERPEKYEWSSYRARAGYETAPSWLAVEPVQSRFSRDVEIARERYRQFIDDGMADPRNYAEEFIAKLMVGRTKWMEAIQRLVDEAEQGCDVPRAEVHIARPELDDVIEAVAQTFDTTAEEIRDSRGTLERRIVAYLAFEDGLITQPKIARALGVTSAAGISSLASRCRSELAKDRDVRALVEACRSRMKRRPPPSIPPPDRPLLTTRRFHRSESRRNR